MVRATCCAMVCWPECPEKSHWWRMLGIHLRLHCVPGSRSVSRLAHNPSHPGDCSALWVWVSAAGQSCVPPLSEGRGPGPAGTCWHPGLTPSRLPLSLTITMPGGALSIALSLTNLVLLPGSKGKANSAKANTEAPQQHGISVISPIPKTREETRALYEVY